jgi:phage shock protein E
VASGTAGAFTRRGNAGQELGVILAMMTLTQISPRPLRPALRRVALALVLSATLGTAAGCAAAAGDTPGASAVLAANTVLIDVRTPAEFAEGHLEGAINIPVELPDFPQRVAELDPDVEYLVYCRSGRRADVALDYMATIGLSGTNLGSVDQASDATGIRVVR